MGSSRIREHLSRSEPLGPGASEATAISFDIFNELSIDDLKTIIQGLFEIAQKLSRFFDGDESVMVMCENESVRENRLNLLLVIKNMASLLADFTKIQNRRTPA
jgi:glycyl-tRNA synthetase beta subunit